MNKSDKTRCAWVNNDPVYQDYHDTEWGVPVHDERLLFEFLMLEGQQAGLSWLTILKKRAQYRLAFDNFNAEIIAHYNSAKLDDLLKNSEIVRNKLKIQAIIHNANALLTLKQEWKSFSDYLWHFVDYQPIQNHWENVQQVPASSIISEKLSADLKKRGFKFVGSTICYAFMQAVGMVNDHTTSCFRYACVRKN